MEVMDHFSGQAHWLMVDVSRHVIVIAPVPVTEVTLCDCEAFGPDTERKEDALTTG
jgi:hypothetical protein